MRYKKLNEHYILDTYTNKKLNHDDIIQLLNNYEDLTQQQRRNVLCQIY